VTLKWSNSSGAQTLRWEEWKLESKPTRWNWKGHNKQERSFIWKNPKQGS